MPELNLDTQTGSYDLPTAIDHRPLTALITPPSDKFYKSSEDNGLYREVIGPHSPWQNQFSVDQSVAYLTVETPFEQWSSACSTWLGYATVDGTHLKRVLPICHPIFEFLRCRRLLNVEGINPLGDRPQLVNGTLGPTFPHAPMVPYDIIRAIQCFETVPFKYKLDEETQEEYERYFWLRVNPTYESLYMIGGSNETTNFLFDEGADVIGPPKKVAFPAGVNIPIPVADVVGTWYDVPLEFIDNADQIGYYQNIFDGIGKLNDDDFLGFPKYSLYMEPPVINLRPNPFPPFVSDQQTFLANVEFHWKYFYPTRLGTGVAENLGHNMAIYRKDLKWYPASVGGDGVTRLFETYDYRKLFRRPL